MFSKKRSFFVMILITVMIVCVGSISPLLAGPDQESWDAQITSTASQDAQVSQKIMRQESPYEMIDRTYKLRFIGITEFMRAVKRLVTNYAETGSSITIQFMRKDLQEIETLLKKLDVEKKSIQLKVYAIVASRAGVPGVVPVSDKTKTNAGKGAKISGIKDAIEDKELKKVLDELKSLWNFQTYEIDGPSYLSIRENSGSNNFKLVTDRYLNLLISNLSIRGEESGQRIISIAQLKLEGKFNFVDEVYFDTHDVIMKERGYLVAGVSGFGSATKAIILILSAEIK